MIKIGVGIVIGLLMGMAIPALGQAMYFKCSVYSGMAETPRGLYLIGAVDTVDLLVTAGRLRAPEMQQRFAGLPNSAFAGAVYGTCLNQPVERVGRVILRLMGYNL